MAYTRVWDPATPAGTRLAKEIDDAIREFKVDFEERIESILKAGTTLDSDPLELADSITGVSLTRQMLFSPHILQPEEDEDDLTWDDNPHFLRMNSDGDPLYGLIPMPIGVKITLFEAWADKNGSTSVTFNLRRCGIATGAISALTGDLVLSTTGIQLTSSAALNYTTQALEYLNLKVTHDPFFSSRPRLYGFRISYERPTGASVY